MHRDHQAASVSAMIIASLLVDLVHIPEPQAMWSISLYNGSMSRIRRWITAKRKIVWSEPGLPPWVKINPGSEPGPTNDPQPGDISMRAVVEEFLGSEEEEAAEPESPEEPRPSDRRDQA